MQKNPCSLTFFVVAVIASFAWIFYVCALTTPGDFVFGLPLPPKENAEEGFFHVPRADMPAVGGESSDMGWTVAKYQSLASLVETEATNVAKQTVHAELGLGRVFGRAAQLDSAVGPELDHRGFKTWAEVCDAITAWAPQAAAFDAEERFTLCSSARTQIYDLWGFATLISLCTAGLSWFICLCPQKMFRRIGGAASLLGAVLGLASLLKWQSAIAQFEEAAGGCGGVLGVGVYVAVGGTPANTLCTNWTAVLGEGATGPARAAAGVCADPNATYWNVPMNEQDKQHNAFACSKGTAMMFGALAIAFSVLQMLLFCLVSGEASDNLDSDSDDDEEQRDAKRVARAKRAAAAGQHGRASDMEFEAIGGGSSSGGGTAAGGAAHRAPRKKQPETQQNNPLSAQYELPRLGASAGSVRNPIVGETESTHI